MFAGLFCWGAVVGVSVSAFSTSAFAGSITTFRSPTDFIAALGSSSYITETYDTYPVDTLIPPGTTLGLVTYTSFPDGLSGRIDNTYATIGGVGNSLAMQDRGDPLTATNFFFPGESVGISFDTPIFAVGLFFNAGPTSTPDDFFIQTPVGTATTGGTVSDYAVDSFFFAGLISTDAFTTATFGGTLGLSTGFNVDNLTFAQVPEPSSSALIGSAILLLAWRRREHSRAREPSPDRGAVENP